MKIYNTYLFDGDGTLFDTADLVCRCFEYVAQKYASISVSRETILAGYGLTLKGLLLKELGDDVDIDLVVDDFIHYQLQMLEKGVSLFPGVMSTLETLKRNGKQLAIVTSRKPLSLGRILELTDTAKFFNVIVTPEDTTLHKPNAAPAILAMSRLLADKAETVFVGDTQYDILCGDSAGVDTVFVNWSYTDPATLPVQPTWRIDSILELIEE